MKRFLIAAALIATAAPAHAQWQGGAPQAAAAAFCASRAAGNDFKRAENDAKRMLVNSMTGSFSTQMAAAFMSGRQMMQTAGYLARQMCPEYFAIAPATPAPTTGTVNLSGVVWDEQARRFVTR